MLTLCREKTKLLFSFVLPLRAKVAFEKLWVERYHRVSRISTGGIFQAPQVCKLQRTRAITVAQGSCLGISRHQVSSRAWGPRSLLRTRWARASPPPGEHFAHPRSLTGNHWDELSRGQRAASWWHVSLQKAGQEETRTQMSFVGEWGDSALSMRQIHLGCHLPTLVSALAGIRLKGHFQVSKEKLFWSTVDESRRLRAALWKGVFKLGLLPGLGRVPVHHPAASDVSSMVDVFHN